MKPRIVGSTLLALWAMLLVLAGCGEIEPPPAVVIPPASSEARGLTVDESDPMPFGPAPSDPASSDPMPFDPQPTNPAASDPMPFDPVPGRPPSPAAAVRAQSLR